MLETLILGLLMIVLILAIGLSLARRLAAKPAPRAVARIEEPTPRDDDKPKQTSPTPSGHGRIVGEVRRDATKKVGDIVGKHPGEAASVPRRWMRGDRPPES